MAGNFFLCGRCVSPDPSNPSEADVKTVLEMEAETEEEEWTPVQQVFANELLLDKILKLSLYDAKDRVDVRTAKSCKLVNSFWLQRVNVVVQRAHLPPVKLNTRKNPNKIARFVEAFTGSPANKIFPFHLTISPYKELVYSCEIEFWYTAEVLHTAMESLWRCGIGVVELTIKCENACWDVTGDPSAFSAGQWNLPHLQKLKIQVELSNKQFHNQNELWLNNPFAVNWLPRQHKSRNRGRSLERSIKSGMLSVSNGKMPELVQSILAASPNLKHLSILSYVFIHFEQQPWGINLKYLELPESLEKIHVTSYSPEWALNVDDMLLSHSQLPNLTSLSLQIDFVERFDLKEKVERILQMLRHQLKKLNIGSADTETYLEVPLRFPVMVSLEQLRGSDWFCRETSSVFPTYFPVLKKFTCFETCPFVLYRWIQENGGVSLSTINVHLRFSDSQCMDDFLRGDQLVLTKMRSLKWTFPNLTQLKVEFFDWEQQFCAMKYIFQQLTQLQVLEADVKYAFVDSDDFNALFLGITDKEARALRKKLSIVNVNYEVGSSIVNLRDLRKMHLSISNFPDVNEQCDLDITVKYGISRMPNLNDFSYSGALSLEDPQEMILWLKPNQRVYRQ